MSEELVGATQSVETDASPAPTGAGEIAISPTATVQSSVLAGPIRGRIDSVDLLRGLVMVIMLLDHTRDFVHIDTFRFDPVDMAHTYPSLFFTRWITHYCAPIFVFLAGTGSYFQIARGKSKSGLSRFLVSRGFWLIFLELVVVRLVSGWEFQIFTLPGIMQVIWALGWSMIVLAALIHLPLALITGFSIAMIALHNLLDTVTVATWQGPGSAIPSLLDKLWMVFHQGGIFPIAGDGSPPMFFLYPLIPWIGVMSAGYAFGRVYDWDLERRRQWLTRVGLLISVGFVLLRAANFYGNPTQWSPQNTAIMTVVSFLNVQKYPPSLLYLMMTLGPALILLALWEGYNRPQGVSARHGRLSNALITFGRVPLFFYLLQWVTAHAAGSFLSTFFGAYGTTVPAPPGGPPGPAVGFDLWVVYVAWLTGILILYPICRWYAGVKSRRRDWWLSYL